MCNVNDERGYLRIGVLAERTGVSPEVLRAWEQRYDLLRPSRSAGGFRLYSDDDLRRVQLTTDLIASGLSTGEAARQALEADISAAPPVDGLLVEDLAGRLREALDAMDAEVAHLAFDRLLASVSIATMLGEVVLPYLRELGDRWATGEVSVAQEHFASNLIRGRLLGLARDWGSGEGPNVLLACPPGEAHDLGLIVFGIEVARRGWRVTFLGADTPIATIEATARRLRPDARGPCSFRPRPRAWGSGCDPIARGRRTGRDRWERESRGRPGDGREPVARRPDRGRSHSDTAPLNVSVYGGVRSVHEQGRLLHGVLPRRIHRR